MRTRALPALILWTLSCNDARSAADSSVAASVPSSSTTLAPPSAARLDNPSARSPSAPPAGPPLTPAESYLLQVHLQTFAEAKQLVEKGKLVGPKVSALLTCGLVLKALPRYREANDPDAAVLIREAPELCNRRVCVMVARESLEAAGADAPACLMADDKLLEAEAEYASDPTVVETRAAYRKRCAKYDRLAAVEGWLKEVGAPRDRYGLLCSMSDERLTRFERARQEQPAIEKQRKQWAATCKVP